MHASAAVAVYREMVDLEGSTSWLYFDTHNPPLPTVGVGNLIGSNAGLSSFGLALPWRKADGAYARESEIVDEFRRLKALGIERLGGYAYREHATLFLDDDVVKWMFARESAAMELALARYFTNWPQLNANAQLALFSMAWNLGPAAFPEWPNLTAAIRARDYIKAADHCRINGVDSDRNRHNRILFGQAARATMREVTVERFHGVKVTIRTSDVAGADPTRHVVAAWWVQYMLREAGFYTSALDGELGPMSRAALASFCRAKRIPAGITYRTLATLAENTLRVTVTA